MKAVMRAALAITVVAAAGFLTVSALHEWGMRPLTSIKVTGPFKQLSRAQLEKAVAISVSHGFFRVDVDAIRAAASRLPWVRSARVRRVWPNSVQIVIDERKAVARWGASSLLEEDGTVFTPASVGRLDKLPRLDGPSGQAAQMLTALWQLQELTRSISKGVRSVRLTERGDWFVTLDSGAELVLDRKPGSGLLARIAPSLPKLFAGRLDKVDRIDMRYGQGFAIRWRGAPVLEDGES